jgi:imidazolonepropionase-like amidohydrolase
MRRLFICLVAAGAAARAAQAQAARPAADSSSVDRPQYPSSYARHSYPPVAITDATIMTAAGGEVAHGSILLRDGKIVAVGTGVQVPPDALRVDGTGKYVTPGIIDPHSHLGVYAAPGTDAESDGNELTNPVTAEVWAEHSFWPQDPQIPLAIAGGVTTIQVLPGSGNLIGGRSAIVKLIPARTVQEMKFPGAHYGYANAALLARAGVKLALLETNTHNARNLRQQAGNAVSYGMRWDEALRAVTLSPAEIFGVAARYGSLDSGKVANVVVWSGDPFELSTRVEHVFIRGTEIPRRSRQTELLERYRVLPPRY